MSSWTDPHLYQSCKTFIERAIGILSMKIQEGEDIPQRVVEVIEVTELNNSGSSLGTDHKVIKQISSLASKFSNDIEKLPEYNALVEYMRKQEPIKSHISSQIGSPYRLEGFHLSHTLRRFLAHTLESKGSAEFDSQIFDRTYGDFEDFFYKDTFEFELFVPLENFYSDDIIEIDLGNRLKLEKIGIEELSSLLTENRSRGGALPTLTLSGMQYAMRMFYEREKIVIPIDENNIDHSLLGDQDLLVPVDKAVAAMRLFKPGFISWSMYEVSSKSWLVGGLSGGALGGSGFRGNNYVLNQSEVEDFSEFWHSFYGLNMGEYPFLETAIRWLNYSYRSNLADDKIISYLIAFEALYLSSINKPEDRGELRFRLSQRVALLLGKKVEERRLISKYMKRAYDLRSEVVHGGKLTNKVRFRGEDIHIGIFLKNVEGYLRKSIVGYVNLAAEGGASGVFVDWDDLAFS